MQYIYLSIIEQILLGKIISKEQVKVYIKKFRQINDKASILIMDALHENSLFLFDQKENIIILE